MEHLPGIALSIPVLAAALISALGRVLPRRADEAVSLLATTATTVLCVVLAIEASDGATIVWAGGWSIQEGVPLGIVLVADAAGAWLAALAAALTTVVLVFSAAYAEPFGKYFTPLLLLLCTAMVGLSFSGDLFNLFVFLELMTVPAFALTAHKIEERPSIQGAFTFAVTSMIAGVLVLFGIAILYASLGTLNLAELGARIAERGGSPAITAAFALIAAGLLTKAAIVPFHFWIADAYAVAPAPVAALFAGIVTDMGIYALVRIRSVAMGDAVPGAGAVLLALGVATAVTGALMCVRQRHLERMLAYSTCAHVGVVLMGAATGGEHAMGGAALYLVAHAALNAGLLLAAGAVLTSHGSVDELELATRGRGQPRLRFVLVLGSVGLAGLPPFATFFGKAAIEEAAIAHGHTLVPWIVSLTTGLTGAGVLRFVLSVFTRLGERVPRDLEGAGDHEPPEPSSPRALLLVAALLLAACLAAGLTPGVHRATAAAASAVVDAGAYRNAVLHDERTAVETAAARPPNAESWRSAVLSVGIALAFALLPFARGVRIAGRGATRALDAVFAPLEAAHAGSVGDYVAWMMAGTAAVGWALLLLE